MANKVSMREYARLRGVNLSAVQNAIKSGRIHTEPDGKIDVEEANRDWFINTDQSKHRVLNGEVVDKKKAAQYAYTLGRSIRDLMLSFPVRYGAIIASELNTDEHTTTLILEKYIRELLSNSEERRV